MPVQAPVLESLVECLAMDLLRFRERSVHIENDRFQFENPIITIVIRPAKSARNTTAINIALRLP